MAGNICGRASTLLNNEIIKLANDGMTTQQIADAVGLTRGATSGRMSSLLANGKLKRQAERTGRVDTGKGRYHILRNRYQRRHGSMMDLLLQLPMEQAEWLCMSAPDGVNVAEWCAVLLRDVISDEMEALE